MITVHRALTSVVL